MTNYVIQFLPVVKPQDWMKLEVGLGEGVYGITLGDLKKYLLGEEVNEEQSNKNENP